MDLLQTICLIVLTLSTLTLWIIKRWKGKPGDKAPTTPTKSAIGKDLYEFIQPLMGFDWATTPPIQLRPFKPKYHLTMAVENMSLSELLAMDSTYLDRIKLREEIMQNHLDSTVQCNAVAEPAVREFYSWIFGVYLPNRFPQTYRLSQNSLLNTANNTNLPLVPPTSPIDTLRLIGENIDTDFLFLLPSPAMSLSQHDDSPTPLYHLQAFVTCFPSGFSTLSKLGLSLSDIHGPVPGYKAKLEKSMDRFFARLPAGRCVRRANWTITTNGQLFCEAGNHLHSSTEDHNNAKTMDMNSPGIQGEIQQQRDAVRVEECRLRTERQTLHRLPQTGALVFSFKTYIYRLEDVKAEGNGEALADAIEGFAKGNVPEFEFYKRGVVYKDKVTQFLRS